MSIQLRPYSAPVALVVLFAIGACGPTAGDQFNQPDADPNLACEPGDDNDGDCLSNATEGCGQVPAPDQDGDGQADYFDIDADNDGIRDSIEVGDDCGMPRDTDGDGMPDFQDRDSDNDGIADENEDRDGDGMLGNCSTACASSGECAAGEACSIGLGGSVGVCASATCLDGESNPLDPDTDDDGVPDGMEGSFICNPQTEDNPNGLKRIKTKDSSETSFDGANWRIALEIAAFEGAPAITNPQNLDSAYTFDINDLEVQLAGFLTTRPASQDTARNEADALVGALNALSTIGNVTTRVSGTPTTSLDGYDTVLNMALVVTTNGVTDVTQLRASIMHVLLNRPQLEVQMPPAGWIGENDTQFMVVIQTVRRADAQQTLFMGAVTRLSFYDDRAKLTSMMADDLANGTSLTVSGNGEEVECDQFLANQQATADIIWVVDESGSTSDDRARIADNAVAFFDKAVNIGLDFRMGVTDTTLDGAGTKPGGQFSTEQAGGTGDRWILSNEPATFDAAMRDPSGPNAVGSGGLEHGLTQGRDTMNLHLPRNDADPQMVREDAKLVIIYVTDEKSEEVEDAGIMSEGNLQPNATQQASIDTLVAPFIADFTTNNAIAHLIAEPLPFDAVCSTGGAEHAYGYYEIVNATGGQVGSICQLDLGPTMDSILDSIIGEASPIVLSKFPISLSIAVARNNAVVARSRDTGWDYRGASNSIIFFNMPFDPLNPADIVVSYRRWADQVPVQ